MKRGKKEAKIRTKRGKNEQTLLPLPLKMLGHTKSALDAAEWELPGRVPGPPGTDTCWGYTAVSSITSPHNDLRASQQGTFL